VAEVGEEQVEVEAGEDGSTFGCTSCRSGFDGVTNASSVLIPRFQSPDCDLHGLVYLYVHCFLYD
jgi:hypothetical protein